jgi:hypothetical protein
MAQKKTVRTTDQQISITRENAACSQQQGGNKDPENMFHFAQLLFRFNDQITHDRDEIKAAGDKLACYHLSVPSFMPIICHLPIYA